MTIKLCVVSLALASHAFAQQGSWCAPSASVRADLQRAVASLRTPEDFDAAIQRLQPLRNSHAPDLFVETKYQDLIDGYAPSSTVRAMPYEYEQLRLQHKGDLLYEYLQGRARQGRATKLAIQSMDHIVATHPRFAPAYRTLAEIYSSPAFYDKAKQNINRDAFMKLCPAETIAPRPGPIPSASPLLAQALRNYNRKEHLDDALTLVNRFVRHEEWRGELVSKFDWYAAKDRVKTAAEVQSNLFKAWKLEILLDRTLSKNAEATEMIRRMETQLPRLKLLKPSAYQEASVTLAQLRSPAKSN